MRGEPAWFQFHLPVASDPARSGPAAPHTVPPGRRTEAWVKAGGTERYGDNFSVNPRLFRNENIVYGNPRGKAFVCSVQTPGKRSPPAVPTANATGRLAEDVAAVLARTPAGLTWTGPLADVSTKRAQAVGPLGFIQIIILMFLVRFMNILLFVRD